MSRDAITVRPNEQAQLQEFLPQAIEQYESQDSIQTNTLEDALDELESTGSGDGEFEFDWGAITMALDDVGSTRAAWLRAKLARRAELAPFKMGFTTSVPIGPHMSETNPKRSYFE
jgi:hypothetical protein